MDVPQKVFSLIDQFKKIESTEYQPSKIKTKFVEPFFKLLGWNIRNKNKVVSPCPDVIKLKKTTPELPDYLFLTNDESKFYVAIPDQFEAVFEDSITVRKLQQICWNANVPIGVITDFSKLIVYDCRSKPGTKIKPILSLEYSHFADQWEKIYKRISKQAVTEGSLKKFSRSSGKFNAIHIQFAEDLINWHISLYKNISSHNPDISSQDVHLTVNRFINRLLFLRICEERGLEPPGTLQELLTKNDIYSKLLDSFRKADEKYNSGIFHFQKESVRTNTSLDTISFSIKIDDQIIKDIISKFYPNNNSYEFSVIPTKIIAMAYDIYISHIPGNLQEAIHYFDYEKSQNMRSDPGVIKYIISKTLGDSIQGKKPGKRSVNSLRIIDLCCGTGLFLLESFQYLLDWHRKKYLNLCLDDRNLFSKLPIYQDGDEVWQLSWKERNRILLNNIYGVDVSRVAVESTSFILLLKLIEGISKKNIDDQLVLFREHALPDLNNNIKCGNALIESDLYKLQQFVQIDEQKKMQINTFDWQSEFHSITTTGGFDIILGKPPVIFFNAITQNTKPYIKQHFTSFEGFAKPYLLFYEKAIKLLKNSGYLGYVVPDNWLTNQATQNLAVDYWIKEVVNVKSPIKAKEPYEVIITILKKQSAGETNLLCVDNFDFENPTNAHTYKDLYFMNLNFFFGKFCQFIGSEITQKIESCSKPLINFAKPYSGYNPYEVGKGTAPSGGPHTAETLKEKPYHSTTKLNENWKTEIIGRDVTRYCLKFSGMRWVKYGAWLAAPRNPEIYKGERILVHERISAHNGRIDSSICKDEVFHGRDIIAIIPTCEFPGILYLLGIINSKLLNWYYLVNDSNDSHNAFPKIFVSNLYNFPIRSIDQRNSQDRNAYQEMLSLVKRILELNQKKLEIRTAREKATAEQLINNIDKQIDDVVYSLYSLSDEEIKIIEDNMG